MSIIRFGATPEVSLPPPFTTALLELFSRVGLLGAGLFLAGTLFLAFFSKVVRWWRREAVQIGNIEMVVAITGLVAALIPLITLIIKLVTGTDGSE